MNNITQERKIWFSNYFNDTLNYHIKRYNTRPDYHIDLQYLFIYEYPIYLETPSNLIGSILNIDSSFDCLEENYFNLFNSNFSFDVICNKLNLTEDFNLEYSNKFIKMYYISFNDYYFALINDNNKFDLLILLSCDSTELHKKNAAKAFIDLIEFIA